MSHEAGKREPRSHGASWHGRQGLRILLSGSLLVVSGCATVRRYPVAPEPERLAEEGRASRQSVSLAVRLVSPTPFMVHVATRADATANFCQALTVSGVVSATGGDTLEFTSARIERRPPGSSDCLDGGPGFVVLSSAPALRAETVRPFRGRTLLFALMVMPFLGALIISPM